MVYQGPRSDPTLPPAVAGPAFLRDGTEVWVRPVQPSDRDLILDLLERHAPEVRAAKGIHPTLSLEELLSPATPDDRLALLVLGDQTDRIAVLGLGEYLRPQPAASVAEVAFLIAAPFRDQGIATLLLARLARAALTFGILRFEARVGAENSEMLEVFRLSGLPPAEATTPGELEVLIPLVPDAGASGASRGTTAPAEGQLESTFPGPRDGRVPRRPPRSSTPRNRL